MTNINLLPWREAQRRERNRATGLLCFGIWLAALLVVYLGKVFMDGRIELQQARNDYLQAEINNLSEVISEIEDLRERRDRLLARMDVIQTLQGNRSQIVHVFDDLVTKLPNGVFYDKISKSGGEITIAGKAQSNNRISALMRNLDSSEWFDNTSLNVVDVIDQDGHLISSFDIEIKEEHQSTDNGGIDVIQ